MAIIGVIVAFAGALLVRLLTVRITTPLADMTHAAEAIAAGDYSRRIAAHRHDEIGRLGDPFNVMTARVEEAHRDLEQRVRERTRELDDALSGLNRRSAAREAYLATIVEGSDDAIIGTSLDGTVQSWNAGAERLYGYRTSEAIGRPATLMTNDRPDELAGLLDRLKRGEHVRHYETLHARKDQTAVTVALTLSPIRDVEGHFCGRIDSCSGCQRTAGARGAAAAGAEFHIRRRDPESAGGARFARRPLSASQIAAAGASRRGVKNSGFSSISVRSQFFVQSSKLWLRFQQPAQRCAARRAASRLR